MKAFARLLHGTVILCLVLLQSASMFSQEWKRFRTAYPFHIQVIALSDPQADGGRTMIVSEPPPSVTLADIQAIDPALRVAYTPKQVLGVDGWVKDVVIDLPALDQEKLDDIVSRLQVRLFGTSYKAYVVGIPASGTQPHLEQLNLRVTSGDLRTWIFGHTNKTPVWPIVRGFLIAGFLLLLMVAFIAGERHALAFISFAVSVVVMIETSGLVTMGVGAVLLGILAIWLLRKSKKIPGGALAVVSVAVLVFLGVRWHSTHRAPDTLFSPVLGGKAVACATLLEQHRNGVFLSTEPGLVLWSFGKSAPIDAKVGEIRQFALDSDLILGAVSSSDQIAIVARERATPVAGLPPLRTETILQLAAAREDELSQSYERKNPFAGRFDMARNMDWAPIYLSPRLIDTEYGSLLNITDQLLKGWTEFGEIEYVNFKYPKPASYPFPKALDQVLGVKRLTFNWNTKGAGYVTKTGDYEVYALNQTGSLPIDYLAEGNPKVQEAEDTAYKYYSGMNDPNLIRVVQYAAIYQIFHHYSVVDSAHPKPAPQAVPSPLIEPTRGLFNLVAQTTDAELGQIDDDRVDAVRHVRDGLRAIAARDRDGSLERTLAGAVASRDGFAAIDAISDEDTKEKLGDVLEGMENIGAYFVPWQFRGRVLERYAELTGARQSPWIHTPSIVESRGTDTGVGGHNLSSRITTFEADEGVTAGHAYVSDATGTRVIHYNPADEGRIGDSVRNAAREDGVTTEQVQGNVESMLGSDNREPARLPKALGFDGNIRPDPLRGFAPAHVPDSMAKIGWRRGGEPMSSGDAKLIRRIGGEQSRPVLVARDSNGVYVISAPPAEPVQAFDLASSMDAFKAVTRDTPDTEVAIHFRGFDDRQAEGFKRNVDEHSEVKVSVASTEEYVSPAKLEEIMNGKYDWTRAELTEEPKILLAEDGLHQELHAKLSVPARDPAKPGLAVRLKITFEKSIEFTQQMWAELKARVVEILTTTKTDDTLVVARMLIDELKKDRRFASVRAEVEHDKKTVLYVKNIVPVADREAIGISA